MSNSGVFDVNDIRYLMDYQQWPTPGELQLIETVTLSTANELDFTADNLTPYNVHLITYSDVINSANADIGLRFYESGTLETGTVYNYALQYGTTGGTFGESKSTGFNKLKFGDVATGSTEKLNGYIYCYNLTDSSKYSFATYHNMREGQMEFGSGVMPQASTVNQINVKLQTGNGSGVFSLYGIRSF
tara:strand:+ start:114 stop:677 length:564 start_codon:yes stop_codon:yes gene_type:complete